MTDDMFATTGAIDQSLRDTYGHVEDLQCVAGDSADEGARAEALYRLIDAKIISIEEIEAQNNPEPMCGMGLPSSTMTHAALVTTGSPITALLPAAKGAAQGRLKAYLFVGKPLPNGKIPRYYLDFTQPLARQVGSESALVLRGRREVDGEEPMTVVVKLRGLNAAHDNRFEREIEASRRLSYCPTFAEPLPDAKGSTYFAMRYESGTTLAGVLQDDGPMQVTQACQLCAEVAAGLVEAKRQDVVHCDIKPDNLFCTDGQKTKILDLGIAVLLDQDPSNIGGTRGYVSPEVARGEQPCSKTDVFGLGLVLYECLTGRPWYDPDIRPRPGEGTKQRIQRRQAAIRRLEQDGRQDERTGLDARFEAILDAITDEGRRGEMRDWLEELKYFVVDRMLSHDRANRCEASDVRAFLAGYINEPPPLAA